MANHKPIRHLRSYTAVVKLDRKRDNSILTEEAGSFLVLSWSLPWGICCRDNCGPQWNTVLVSIVKDILTQRKSLKWLPETEFHSFGSNTVHQYSQRLLHRTKHTTAFFQICLHFTIVMYGPTYRLLKFPVLRGWIRTLNLITKSKQIWLQGAFPDQRRASTLDVTRYVGFFRQGRKGNSI